MVVSGTPELDLIMAAPNRRPSAEAGNQMVSLRPASYGGNQTIQARCLDAMLGVVSRNSGVDAQTAASILSEMTGRPFRLVGQLSGGETGAHKFIGPNGRPIVVKWDTTSDGRALRGEAGSS